MTARSWLAAHRNAVSDTGAAACGTVLAYAGLTDHSPGVVVAGLIFLILAGRDPAKAVWRRSLRGSVGACAPDCGNRESAARASGSQSRDGSAAGSPVAGEALPDPLLHVSTHSGAERRITNVGTQQ